MGEALAALPPGVGVLAEMVDPKTGASSATCRRA